MGKDLKGKKRLRSTFKDSSWERLWATAMKTNTVFMLQTGLRTGELTGLRWQDIDFAKRTMKIERTMEYRYKVGEWRVGPPKSRSGYRTIPLTEEAIRILKNQQKKNESLDVPEE